LPKILQPKLRKESTQMPHDDFDITPHPRILQVLGEIEFKPWQCVAELVDNSVDQFITMSRQGTPVDRPIVQVAFGNNTVVVKDNGPGMSHEDLQKAVKAGWSSNERFGNLGLYGVGFNIATARLGKKTTIWTTQKGQSSWIGLELDLQALARGSTFTVPKMQRPKAIKDESGTEVEVSNIKHDWRTQLGNSTWVKAHVGERLARIYSTMLDPNYALPIFFELALNGRKLQPWRHCVWPQDRSCYRRSEGLIAPLQEIDTVFSKRVVDKLSGEVIDPSSDYDKHGVITIEDRVYGWVGIQKYADEKDFGIDILRNGRKIELLCKDLFQWEDESGHIELEYPIDDPRGRGRIVGEIHLDHGYVHYTKHRFEREHYSWLQLLAAVKGNEPLTKRASRGLSGVNTSPLGTLFRTFRRNSPSAGSNQKWSDILFIKDNDAAKSWAARARKNEAPFNTEEFWVAELDKCDLPTEQTSEQTETTAVIEEILGIVSETQSQETARIGETQIGEVPNQSEKKHVKHLGMSVAGLFEGAQHYDFEVFEVDRLEGGIPWTSLSTTRGVYEVLIARKAACFKHVRFDPRDAVLVEAAKVIYEEEKARSRGQFSTTFSKIHAELRDRYATDGSLAVETLRSDINEYGQRFFFKAEALLERKTQKALLKLLPQPELERLQLYAASEDAGGINLFRALDASHLQLFLENMPEPFMRDGLFDRNPWTRPNLNSPKLLEAYQKMLVADILSPLRIVAAFRSVQGSEPTISKLRLVRSALDRLIEQTHLL
jgi:hypothetical protein